MEQICLNCNKTLKGRADKKYCDENCRNQYNNSKNSDINSEMRRTQNILRKNRRILEKMLGDQEKVTFPVKRLTDMGFKLDYMTQLYMTKTGTIYKYTFEYGILELEDDKILIVKKGKSTL